MPTCPTMPSVPQDVLLRFRTMRDFDAKLRKFAEDLCGLIPGTETTDDLESRLAELETDFADFSAHIASHVVHGTVSDVVGKTDFQSLENKTIGFLGPGYGRFTHSLQSNTVPAFETLTVPTGYNMVNTGTYTIDGILTVDGAAAFL